MQPTVSPTPPEASQTASPLTLNRRAFLFASAATVALGAASASAETGEQRTRLLVKPLQIPNLPVEFEGYRIGFLTDPHLGIFMPPEWIESALETLKRASIDLLLLGGDYIAFEDTLRAQDSVFARNPRFANYHQKELPVRLLADFCDLLSPYRPKDGIAAVIGNHDRYVGLDVAQTLFARNSARLLVNESFTVHRGSSELAIDGVDDLWYGSPHVPRGAESPGKRSRVLLTHNPDYFTVALAQTTYSFSLGLAGHTHGGQIRLPLLGAFKHNCFDRRFFEGLRQVRDAHIYTSRGIGFTLLPWRLHCPPEVCVFSLERA